MMIYADANATYPVCAQHYDDVAALLKQSDGNPSSIHGQGRKAKVALEQARSSMAAMLGCKPLEVIFTSGATESNNCLIHGLIGKLRAEGVQKPHVLVCEIEHRSVIEPAKALASRGDVDLEMIPVTKQGQIDIEVLERLLLPDTALVCVMYANNEIGSVNDLRALMELVKSRSPKAHFHSDAVQQLGKADLTWLGKSGVDSASFSGHKIGAFKGVGSLFLRSGCKLSLFLSGGGQERGRRAGTENIPGILSFGLRCQEVLGTESAISNAMAKVRQVLVDGIGKISGAVVHGGDPRWMLPNTVHFHVDKVPGDDILLNFDLEGIQVSSGSACSSGSARPSYVVEALGYSEWVALNSIRMSFSGSSTTEEAEQILRVLEQVTLRVRGYL